MPYLDYDFATKTSGEEFNCNAPTNDSPHNTGLKRLPSVDAARRLVHVHEVAAVPGARPGGRRRAASRRWAAPPMSRAGQRVRVPLPELLQGRAAVLRVVARLHQGVPPQRPQAGRDPAVPGDRRQPDGHRVRAGRRALRARVRRRLLRREPGRAAGEDQLRPRQPHADREGRGRRRRAGRAPLDGQVLQRWDQRPGRRPDRLRVGLRVRRHGRLDRGQPEVHLRPPRAPTTRPCGSPTAPGASARPRSRCSSATPSRSSS